MIKEKSIYISGAISGMAIEEARRRFDDAEKYLRQKYPGAMIVNPMNNGLPDTASWEEHMFADIRLMQPCDTVYFLTNWKGSSGANVEFIWAKKTSKKLLFQHKSHKI